ncbi:MAG: hypothetical protein JXR27_00480 [Paludibacteraceae bacterium]|nr:hypothetical protein [Paludibacteraceae bacterium]
MKTINLKSILAVTVLLLSTAFVAAQSRTCTVIDVTDGYYTDRVWVFSVEGTTDGFDNGWDGSKFLSSNATGPQVYYMGTDGNYQVSTTNDVHGDVIGFIPGNEGGEYTFTFTQYDLALTYQQLFLVDRISNVTVDITADGSTYTFTANADDPADRFSLATSIEVVEEPVVEEPAEEEEDVVVPNDPKDKKDKKDKKGKKDKKVNKAEKVKVHSHGKKIMVNNPNKEKAKVKVINARNGKVITETTVGPEGPSTIETNTQGGTYVVAVAVETDVETTTVLIK